ncbi:hypothetical protein CSKR_101346 [Clonorchis sinensis]|uniref:Uncharacterized protein n=1 Tax=Clonorchis sinensis TaxID=79923 RepID=A0A3R7CPT7_CLOSI|nr:hypothetical protein CSKR_101346 [Clonorchis sinensis]
MSVQVGISKARLVNWLEREFTDRKVRCSNPTSASQLLLSRLGQPGSVAALVLPPSGWFEISACSVSMCVC